MPPQAPASTTITVVELLRRVRALPAPPEPLAARLAAARRNPRRIPWRQIAALDEPAAFVTAAYRALLGREPHAGELAAAAMPRTRAARLAYLDGLRQSAEARLLPARLPGLWLAARVAGFFAR